MEVDGPAIEVNGPVAIEIPNGRDFEVDGLGPEVVGPIRQVDGPTANLVSNGHDFEPLAISSPSPAAPLILVDHIEESIPPEGINVQSNPDWFLNHSPPDLDFASFNSLSNYSKLNAWVYKLEEMDKARRQPPSQHDKLLLLLGM